MGNDAIDDARVVLGQAIRRRAQDVSQHVLEDWQPRSSKVNVPLPLAEEIVRYTCWHGTDLIGRWLVTGEGATSQEMQDLAERSTTFVRDRFAMTDVVKNNLAWRDAVLRIVQEEADRLGSPRELVTEVRAVVRFSGDTSVVNVIREYDAQRKALQDELEIERGKLTYLALHDSLTGLANRTLLLDRLTHAIAGSARRVERVGVLYLDLDGFKAVNDRLGHAAGDRLLVTMARRLVSLVRPSDTVARLGGDEFVVVCNDLALGEEALASIANRVRRGLETIVSESEELVIRASIGAAIAGPGADPEAVLAEADAAMYAAKRNLRCADA